MDIATIVGLLGASTLILIAMKDPMTFYNTESILIVVGGTIMATLAANPLGQVGGIVSVYLKTIKTSAASPNELIEKIVGFAETARREGILALEQAVEEANDEFLSGGIRLAVDGTEPDLIMDILETELLYIEERHNQASEMIARAAEMAEPPTQQDECEPYGHGATETGHRVRTGGEHHLRSEARAGRRADLDDDREGAGADRGHLDPHCCRPGRENHPLPGRHLEAGRHQLHDHFERGVPGVLDRHGERCSVSGEVEHRCLRERDGGGDGIELRRHRRGRFGGVGRGDE